MKQRLGFICLMWKRNNPWNIVHESQLFQNLPLFPRNCALNLSAQTSSSQLPAKWSCHQSALVRENEGFSLHHLNVPLLLFGLSQYTWSERSKALLTDCIVVIITVTISNSGASPWKVHIFPVNKSQIICWPVNSAWSQQMTGPEKMACRSKTSRKQPSVHLDFWVWHSCIFKTQKSRWSWPEVLCFPPFQWWQEPNRECEGRPM